MCWEVLHHAWTENEREKFERRRMSRKRKWSYSKAIDDKFVTPQSFVFVKKRRRLRENARRDRRMAVMVV